jgi:chromatin segregation and condensation protein Rec8/ScpA/Scc1 (kleisin family)
MLEHRIRDLHSKLLRARAELALIEEQLAVVNDEAEDARVRSLVSETPLATHEYAEVRRHADAMERARDTMQARVNELALRRDELISHVGVDR